MPSESNLQFEIKTTATVKEAAFTLEQIRDALQMDPEFFINFYLAEELTTPVPLFHKQIFSNMIDLAIEYEAEAVPRDHAKTTLAKLAAMYFFRCTPIRYIIYLSNTHPVAANACEDIMAFFEHDNDNAVFGEIIRKEVDQKSNGFYHFVIWDHQTQTEKECILSAHGRQKQIRGLNITHQRPQVMFLDDLEDEETAGSEEVFKKVKRWLYGAAMRAMDKKWSKIIHIGNIHGQRSILDAHCKSNYWHSHRYSALLSNGQPLWEEVWPLSKLRQNYQQYQDAGEADLWFAEMMNNPLAGARRLISASEIFYLPAIDPQEARYGFLTLDPSISEKRTADDFAIVVHIFNTKFEIWQVAEVVTPRTKDINSIFRRVVELMLKWGVYVCAVESYGYQAVIKPIFEHFKAMHYPFLDCKFLTVNHGKSSKTAHIQAWTSMLTHGDKKTPTYALTRGDIRITEQLLSYDTGIKDNKSDDIIDACSYGPQVIRFYMHEIMKKRHQLPSSTALGSYQVSRV